MGVGELTQPPYRRCQIHVAGGPEAQAEIFACVFAASATKDRTGTHLLAYCPLCGAAHTMSAEHPEITCNSRNGHGAILLHVDAEWLMGGSA